MISGFTLHDTTTAPAASTGILEGVQKFWGVVPNLYGVLAESPAALEAYSPQAWWRMCTLAPRWKMALPRTRLDRDPGRLRLRAARRDAHAGRSGRREGNGHAVSRDGRIHLCRSYGEALGYEDVFTKLEHATRHYEAVGLGKEYVKRIVR
jgi:hypothetical protein